MKVIHKYILRETFIPTILGLLFFTFVLLINKLFTMIEFLMNRNVDLSLIGGLLSCLAPFFLTFTLPMGLLVGVIIAYGRMAADNEIIAMKTNGISLMSLYLPTIISSFILSMVLMGLNYEAKPKLLSKAADIIYEIQFKVLTSIEPQRFYGELTGGDIDLVLYCGDKDYKTNELKNISIKLSSNLDQMQAAAKNKEKLKQLNEDKLANEEQARKLKEKSEDLSKKYKDDQKEVLMLASSGMVEGDIEDDEIRLKLKDGSIHLLSRNNDIQNNMVFFKEIVKVMQPKFDKSRGGGGFLKPRKRMTIPELEKEISKLKPTKKESRMLRVEYHSRFSQPLACLAFALIAMPLGVFIRPSGKSYGFAIAFGLLFVYYLFESWGKALLENGSSLGLFAMYSPNIIIGIVGIILIMYSLRK